jgi:hypothetical protein
MLDRLQYVLAVSIALLPCSSFAQSADSSKSETIVYENREIYSAHSDGTNVIALTHNGMYNTLPNWSPDGQHIVLWHGVASFRNEISVMDRDGGNYHLLHFSPDDFDTPRKFAETMRVPGSRTIHWATWLPNGKLALTIGSGGLAMTFQADPDGKDQPREVLSGAEGPQWSRDGQEVAYTTDSVVHIANSDGSARLSLPFDSGMRPSHIAWSPDGGRIAFDANPQGRQFDRQIFTVNRDGSALQQISNDPRWETCLHPSWSPDGKRITFSCREGGPCAGAGSHPCIFRIFVISVVKPESKLVPINGEQALYPAFAPN